MVKIRSAYTAQSILDNRYGDCKDHVVLLEALLRAVGIESSPALVNLGEAYSLPTLAISAPFNHVITHVPELGLYLDSTAQFAPIGTLPEEVMDKPVLLTATGQIARTPRSDPARDFTHDEVTLTLEPDGRIRGSSRTRKGGLLEVDSRSAHYQRADREESITVSQLLGRFRETGRGRINHPDPLDLGTPWALEAAFELDPVINLPGRAALALPLGLASGDIRMIARSTASPDRRYEGLCSSVRHTEQISLRLPATVRVESIPPNVSFHRGPLRYEARYRLEGEVLHANREYISTRSRPVCNASDEADFDALLGVLRRDLRGQVFLR